MIGRSLLVLQLGKDQNELHFENPLGMSMTFWNDDKIDEELRNKIIAIRTEAMQTKKEWNPVAVVDDNEVVAIYSASNCIGPDHQGYHKWASDGVTIINISDDPNLSDPTAHIKAKKKAAREKRTKALEQIKQYLPELRELKKKVKQGQVIIDFPIIANLQIQIHSSATNPVGFLNVLNIGHINNLIDQNELEKVPEIAERINCPFRKAYVDRCNEIACSLGLSMDDVQNAFPLKEQLSS